ncbi:hypothetical protein LJC06_02755 [Bacteroidales bacterium OttesenSCG-928-I14]|nr:hypothetical protein [Bacteroidales bacterium OttesenSCG-928-I14]
MRKYLLITGVLFILSINLNAGSWDNHNNWAYPKMESYSTEMPSESFYNTFQQDTYSNPILRVLGDDDDEDGLNEGGNAGSQDGDANDMPIGDGMSVFIFCIVFYISIVLLRSQDRYLKVLDIFKGFKALKEIN